MLSLSSASVCSKRRQHQRQGSAEFVADVVEEGRFGAIQFCQCFHSLAFFFKRAGISDRCRNVACHQIKKFSVLILKGSRGLIPNTKNPTI
jgi:hypothetical protein